MRHGGYWAFGQGRLGEAIAVGDRVFRAFFDIEDEVEREPSTVRPLWIRRLSAIADEIAGVWRHVILVWSRLPRLSGELADEGDVVRVDRLEIGMPEGDRDLTAVIGAVGSEME